MTSSIRNYSLLTAACIIWALFGSIFYGIQWSSDHEGRWVEWIVGGQLRWLPWVAFAYLIVNVSRRLENGSWDLAAKTLTHLSVAISIVLLHATYLRLIRPIPPMLLYGRSYSEVFARFRFTDYLSYQSVFLDLAVYMAIAIPVMLAFRWSRQSSFQIASTEPDIPSSKQLDSVALSQAAQDDQPLDRILIRLADKAVVLPVCEIEWIEAADYYVQLHARGEKYLHRESIQNLEKQLDPACFIRVHRRSLVNSVMIVELVALSNSKWAVRMKSGALVEVSRRRRRQVENSLTTCR